MGPKVSKCLQKSCMNETVKLVVLLRNNGNNSEKHGFHLNCQKIFVHAEGHFQLQLYVAVNVACSIACHVLLYRQLLGTRLELRSYNSLPYGETHL